MEFSGTIRKILLVLVALTLVVWAFTVGPLSPLLKKFTGNPTRPLQAENFKFTPVTRQDIHRKVLATGSVTLKTGAEVKIGARISGKVKELKVQIGDFVKEGDRIAVIEHEDLLARVARFKADLRAEQARLIKIREEGPLEINKDNAELEEQRVQHAMAQKMYKRNLELSAKGFVSTTAVDEWHEKVEVLKAKIRLAQEELKLQEARLQNDIRLAEAMVEKARANLKEEQTRLTYAKIDAPISGVVAFISTQEGETVVASLSAPTFVTLIDLLKLEVTVFVDETDIGQVKVGQQARFTVDAYSDKFFDGVVRDIHPKAVIKDNVVNYEVILDIDPENIALLRPEMTANVVITTGTRKDVLTLPKEAVKRKGKQTFAVVQAGGGLAEKAIETGWREAGRVEIVSGLEEGEQVGVPVKPKVDERRRGRPRRR